MKHNRFSMERIMSILKEYEAGARMADLSRKHGVSEQSLFGYNAHHSDGYVPVRINTSI